MQSKKHLLGLISLSTLLFLGAAMPLAPESVKVKFPKKVNNIIQDKCYGCHNPDARGEKSRKALNWDELGDLDKEVQLGQFQKITKVLEEGAMPPKRMLERNPDKKLTEKETKQLQKWAAKLERKAAK